MTRVLLLCPEPLGHHHPAGIGIRFLEFARLLRAKGFHVTLLSRDGAKLEGYECGDLAPAPILSASQKADTVIVQGHVANDFFACDVRVPTVVDLYDPFIIENLHYTDQRNGTYVHDHATLMRSLARGDFFLCASETQRIFYVGLLLAAGRVNPALFEADPELNSLISIAPFGVPPANSISRDERTRHSLFFGGIYDWYDPILACEATAIARKNIANLTLTFTYHPNSSLTPQSVFEETRSHVARSGYETFVHFIPWIPYEERGISYASYDAAILTFPQSLETDLSMRTRVFDYLWGGLPVISSSARGTNAVIERYDCGVVVNENDASRFAAAIENTLTNEVRYQQMVTNAAGFVRDHQWETLAQPLIDFLSDPKLETTRDSYRLRGFEIESPPQSFVSRLKQKIGGGS